MKGRSADRRYAPRSKQSPYEGGIRTPILVRWPRPVSEGGVTQKFDEQTLVSSIDLAPTILKACGLEVPKSMPGLDLRDTASLRARNAIFGAAYDHDVADVRKPNESLKTRYVVTGNWKLLVPNNKVLPNAKIELFNVANDPEEKTDLAAKNPAKVKELSAQLDAWWPGPGSN